MVKGKMNEKVKEILEEINKVIRGKDAVIERILMAILAEGNILLEDVPGVGKTTMALALSAVPWDCVSTDPVYTRHYAIRYYRIYDVRSAKRNLSIPGRTGAAVQSAFGR